MRDIALKSMDAMEALNTKNTGSAIGINAYIWTTYNQLQTLWNKKFKGQIPSGLGRHIAFGSARDYSDILRSDLPALEEAIEVVLLSANEKKGDLAFENLLHKAIMQSSYRQYRNGEFRDAVFNSVLAVFDQIRRLTGIDDDGEGLVNKAFSLDDPYLVFSDLTTESGKNDQKGFMQILRGTYQGIRNPKAHTLEHDLTEEKAAQYLIFTSLLARRIDESKLLKKPARTKGRPLKPGAKGVP